MSLRIGATLSEWGQVLRLHAADHAPDMEVVLVRDRRAALDAELAVICLDLATVWVDAAFVDALQTAGVTVVGVFADDAESARWAEWGVDHRLHRDVTAEHMVYLLEALRPHTVVREPPVHDTPDDPDGDGSVLVVGGPSGSGAREVAVGIADRLAGVAATLLVDCNETGGTIAARLAYAEHPNLLSAVAVANRHGDLTSTLAAPQSGRPKVAFDVLAGIPSAGEWSHVSPGSVRQVIDTARAQWRHVVAATGPVVEDLRRWVDRYGVSRELLATAPAVVGVCAASPKGVLAFANWLAATRPATTVQVVVNKVPGGSPFHFGEVAERLRSLCGPAIEVVDELPWDRRVTRAEWNGALVRSGRYAKALDRVTDALSLDPVTEGAAW